MNEEIKAPEAKFKAIINNIKEGYFEVDLEGNLTFFNDTLCELTRFSRSELLGLNYKYITDEESRKKIFNGFNSVYKTGKELADFQYKFKDKHGKTIIGETSVYLKYDTKGNKVGFYGLFRDITKRKEEEEKFKAKLERLVDKRAKELKESEEKYRLITENANDIIDILNRNFIIEFANEQATFNILGYKSSEVVGKSVLDFLHPLDKNKGLNSLLKGTHEKEGMDEIRVRHKNGTYIWLEVKGKVFVDRNGENKGILIGRDITSRKEGELKLKESEEKFRTLTEQSFLGIAIIQDNLTKYVNKRISETFGYSIDEVMTWQPGEFIKRIHPDDRNFVVEQVRKKQLGEPNAIDQYQFRGLKKNGDIIWLEVFSITINYEGKPADFVTLIDITEKKEAEAKLKESEQQYRSTIDSIRDPIHVIDKDLKIILINNSIRKWLKILDIKEDIIGKKLNEVFTFLSKKVFNEYIQVFTTGKPLISEETSVIKDEIYYTESIKIPIFSEDLVIQVITIIRDISDHKLAQQKLKRSKRKYREAFNRSNFYKDLISHDINNILQNILSSIELSSIYLNEGKDTNELKQLLKISREQVSRGANLISNVRKLSSLEETEISTHPIEAIEVLNQSIDFLLNNYQDKKINIDIENPYKTVTVQGNELLIEIFENILINAVKHNQNFPIELKIRVSKIQKDNYNFVKFEFKDNGIGISDPDKEIIFQRAYSIDKTISGMGIGLSLVKKVLNTYQGQIWVDDRIEGDYSKGSNFVILIPEV